MSTATAEQLVRAEPSEAGALVALRSQLQGLEKNHRVAQLIGSEGQAVSLPESVAHLLLLAVEALAQGQTVTLIPHGQELTTQEAADILHVSRPHLVRLLDEGAIPHHRVGTHRRVRIEDVLTYRAERARKRRAELEELVRLSEEAEGGYV